MRICEAEIKNVGPIRDLSVKLKQGSIGIFGPNGAGKSVFLSAMYGCLTNDFSRIASVKKGCINDRCGGDASFVRLMLEQNGEEIELFRGLSPAKQELKRRGCKSLTKDKEIQSALEELGVSTNLLDFCVFKRQNEIYDFLKSTPAERALAYQALNDTAVCEKLHEVLGDKLVALSSSLPVEGRLEDAERQVGELRVEIEKREKDLRKLEKSKMSTSARSTIAGKLAKAKSAAEAKLKAVEIAEIVKTLKSTIAAEEKTLADIEAKYDDAEDDAKEKADEAQKAKIDLARYESDKKLREARDRWQGEIETGRKRLESLAVAEVDFDETADELREERSSLSSRLRKAREGLELFEKSGKTVCPTCGTAGKTLQESLTALKKDIKTVPSLISAVGEKLQVLEAVAARDEVSKSIARAQKSLAELGKPLQLSCSVAELNCKVKDAENSAAEVSRLAAEIKRISTRLASGKAALAEKLKQYEALRTEHASSKMSSSELDKLLKEIEADDAVLAEIYGVAGEQKEASRRVEALERSIAELRAERERGTRISTIVPLMQRFRELVHKKSLPQLVARKNLARIEGDINANLGLFGDPFRIESDDDLGFRVFFPGEPVKPAERLSGGQSVVLAVSFWAAIHALYRSKIGMLCLDEPTANLDGANRIFLREALSKLTSKVRGRRQIVIVTHADELRGAFDQVIEMRKD